MKELGEENVAKATRDKVFQHDSIPMTDTSDNPILARFLDDLPRVKTPKPDRAYGLAKSAFTEKERVINDIMAYLSKVSSQMFHTIFIVESKSIYTSHRRSSPTSLPRRYRNDQFHEKAQNKGRDLQR